MELESFYSVEGSMRSTFQVEFALYGNITGTGASRVPRGPRVLLAKVAETRAVVFAREVGEKLWGFQISPFCESIEVVNAINGKMDWMIESNIF